MRSKIAIVAALAACGMGLAGSAAPIADAAISRAEAYRVARAHAKDTCRRISTCLRGSTNRCQRRGSNFWTCKNLLVGILPVLCTYRVDVFVKGKRITTSRPYDSKC
jgi:hypothetical protein